MGEWEGGEERILSEAAARAAERGTARLRGTARGQHQPGQASTCHQRAGHKRHPHEPLLHGGLLFPQIADHLSALVCYVLCIQARCIQLLTAGFQLPHNFIMLFAKVAQLFPVLLSLQRNLGCEQQSCKLCNGGCQLLLMLLSTQRFWAAARTRTLCRAAMKPHPSCEWPGSRSSVRLSTSVCTRAGSGQRSLHTLLQSSPA